MPTTEEILKAQRTIEQKRAADKALLEAGVKPKLRIVKGRQNTDSKFSGAFEKALEEYKAKSPCPKCNNDKPEIGGPYCDCELGQYWLKNHREWAEAERTRQQEHQAQRRKELTKKLQKAGGFVIPPKYEEFTPRTLHEKYGQTVYDQKKSAITRAMAWADGKLERPSLFISGIPGTGKSALCFWAVKRRIRRTAEMPLLIQYRQFIDIIQRCYRPDSKEHKLDFIMGAQQAEILMFDDFGQVHLPLGQEATPDKQEIILQVLNLRTQYDRATLIVSNLTQARLEAQFHESIIGRLKELCIFVEMGGKNLREKGTVGW